jgi:hypothetical protein
MKDIDAQKILEAYEAVNPETGERMSPKAKAKHVQWTKDIKAKLAQAQEIGDSKEANKLQRYLDMHGIDEADDSDIDHHTQYKTDQDLLNPLHAAAQKAGADNINDWMIKQIKEKGEGWIKNFIETVIGAAPAAEPAKSGYDDAAGTRKWKATHKDRGYIPGHHD